MSSKRDKNVSQLVEKYKREFPTLEKKFIRRLIKSENKELFDNNPSEVRKLSRYLEKAFRNENKNSPTKVTTDKENKTSTENKSQPTPGEMGIRHLQWRGTPEGGGSRFFAGMFPVPEERKKQKPVNNKPIYIPPLKSKQFSDKIPNPDEIRASQSRKRSEHMKTPKKKIID